MAYVELHAHSAYSFLDGASSPAELAAAAAELGYPAMALTDHDGLWGSMEFAQACRGLGVRAITGAEVTRRRLPRHAARRERRRVPQPLPAAHRVPSGDAAASRARAPPPLHRPRRARAPRRGARSASRGAPATGRWRGAGSAGGCATRRRWAGACSPRSGAIACGSSCSGRSGAATAQRNRWLEGLAERLGVECVATGNVHAHDRSRSQLQDALVAVRLRRPLDETEPERRGNATSALAGAGGDGGALRRAPARGGGERRAGGAAASSTSRATWATAIPAPTTPTRTARSPSSAGRGSSTATRGRASGPRRGGGSRTSWR